MKFLIKKQKGFTLIELMISIFIFMIIVSIIIEIFGKQVVTSRYARILQRNIEDAEFAMNYVAKTLRTSNLPINEYLGDDVNAVVVDQDAGTIYTDVLYAYDYSQKTCFKFSFEEFKEEQALVVYTIEEIDNNVVGSAKTACAYDDNYPNEGRRLTSGNVTGGFYMSPTNKDDLDSEKDPENLIYDESMGKVTISLKIDNRMSESVEQGNEGVQNMIIIQTSVALRDYPGDLTF